MKAINQLKNMDSQFFSYYILERDRGLLCRSRYLVIKGVMPQLEHKQGPEARRVISSITTVLIQQQVDIFWIDISTLPGTPIRKGLMNAPAQLLIDPFLDRNSKALFGPIQDLRRH